MIGRGLGEFILFVSQPIYIHGIALPQPQLQRVNVSLPDISSISSRLLSNGFLSKPGRHHGERGTSLLAARKPVSHPGQQGVQTNNVFTLFAPDCLRELESRESVSYPALGHLCPQRSMYDPFRLGKGHGGSRGGSHRHPTLH